MREKRFDSARMATTAGRTRGLGKHGSVCGTQIGVESAENEIF